jgi:putative addiction module component (TIGR02574 family)
LSPGIAAFVHADETMSTFDDVLGAAQDLPPEDRLRLIVALWDNFPPNEWPALSEEWIAEVQRRSAEYDAGRMSASNWPDVRDRARRRAGMDA